MASPIRSKMFEKALILDTEIVRKTGIDDPDVRPLWDSMSGTLWTRE